MNRRFIAIAYLTLVFVLAHLPAGGEDGKAFERAMREIPFQNDSQWEDNRWQESDVGPFLAGTIGLKNGVTLKGLVVRVGDNGRAAICFDTSRMRVSTAWTGDFLKFGPRRFGLISPPSVAGDVAFSTAKIAGWAKAGRFKPEPNEITLPELEAGYTKPGASETCLPHDWAHFQGHYASGNRVVFSYTVGETQVLESPWFSENPDGQVFTRSLEISPSIESMTLLVADSKSKIAVMGSTGKVTREKDRVLLSIAPHTETLRLKLLIATPETTAEGFEELKASAGNIEDLSTMIKSDEGRYREVLATKGTTTEEGGPYVVDTLTLPFENPWNALFFTAGHDFFSDGSAAICTAHGDVWTVSGIDRTLEKLSWRRYATGLCQPLGLKIVDDNVYVLGRNQITRLHDRNRDGEADYYENFNNDMLIAPRAHDYVTCLDTDSTGNFYFIHAKTGVMRLSADGSTLTAVADGFRNPNGLGVSPDGLITAAPQQGAWTPESCLIAVTEGGYYGYGGPRVTADRPTGWDLPMCFIPRSMDNSGGGQSWVTSDRWGPLSGLMLHHSFGQCKTLLALTEDADGVMQGGTITLPMTPGDFESGSMRGRHSPHDGQLYVSGLRGWQTRAIRDGCFQRVRYTGGEVNLPVAVKTFTNGIKLTFSEPLSSEFAENADNYFVEQWNYLWSKEYGSPEFSVVNPNEQGRDEVVVRSATAMDGGRSVFLEMPDRSPVHQLAINWFLVSAKGKAFRGTYAHTINVTPKDTVSPSQIKRRKQQPLVSPSVQERLRSGLQYKYETLARDRTDVRVSRLLNLHQATDAPSTPFMPAGPFSITAEGTLKVSLSGFYDFRIESTGEAELSLNGQSVDVDPATGQTVEPLLLRKGHNLLRMTFVSPETGVAKFAVSWKGHNFSWEPLPPSALFHDSGSNELIAATLRREGRELFANHRCANCHRTAVGDQPMFEMTLDAPDLIGVGSRFNEAWIAEWLLDPESLKPGSHMPAVLAGDKQVAADIAAYLATEFRDAETPLAAGGHEIDGADLYETLGCITCHHFDAPRKTDTYGRLSLHHAGAKFADGALVRFLQNPGAFHSATGMPHFGLNASEAEALAKFVLAEATGKIKSLELKGDATRGKQLYDEARCQQCHAVGKDKVEEPFLAWEGADLNSGCLSGDSSKRRVAPVFAFTDEQLRTLRDLVNADLPSVAVAIPSEISLRTVGRLKCASCHDRDGRRSHRGVVIAEEGTGASPEVVPSLMWAGEKFQLAWTKDLLEGKLGYKTRPWVKARMPAFHTFANVISHGLAVEHGVDPDAKVVLELDPELAAIGEKLTLQSGLDCRQCHAVGDLQPRGDKNTKIAEGINFAYIRDRMRHESYHRFMLDPSRYDINTKMIRLSENGLTTKLKSVFDASAHLQFDAVWHYMQRIDSPSLGKQQQK